MDKMCKSNFEKQDNNHLKPKRNNIFADETLLVIACAVIIFVIGIYASSNDNIEAIQLIPDTNIQK